MKESDHEKNGKVECTHKNVKEEAGFLVCQDCGLILSDQVVFDRDSYTSDFYGPSQLEYEKKISLKDSKAKQDPIIKEKYDHLITLDKWFRDSKSSFGEQRKTLDLLKSYNIGQNIDQTKYQEIKERYLRYNRKTRKTYQNMVIIFLAIVWLEIKDTTNIRIEQYIHACNELGHKINKKMLNKAMEKIKKTEEKWYRYQGDKVEGNAQLIRNKLESDIKNKIKILFQKNLNDISFGEVKHEFSDLKEFEQLKIEMQLLLDDLLNKISYQDIKNLNYKAFTAGLLYYIGQALENERSKIFTQNLIESLSNFSATTIRKKYKILTNLLGDPTSISDMELKEKQL